MMGSSSPGVGHAEGVGSSSNVRQDSDTDSNEEDDPINLIRPQSVLADDPLREEPRSRYAP